MAHAWRTNLKDALFIASADTTHDDLLDDILEDVEQAIEDYTGLTLFDPGADVTEYHDGTGTRFLFLDAAPIKSITSIHIDGTRSFGSAYLADSTSYIFTADDKDAKIRMAYSPTASIQFGEFFEGDDNVKVVFRPGWATASVPNSLRRAALLWGAFAFKRWQSKTHDVKAKNMADGSVSFLEFKPPPEVEQLLIQWQRNAVA